MLRLHLLGPLRILLDETPIDLATPPKTLELLTYLLLHRRQTFTRDQLAFALWTDRSEADARGQLRRYLYRLRQLLPRGDWLMTNGAQVQWNTAADYWLDVEEFERGGRGRPDEMEAAVEVYTADLLLDRYEDWIIIERERLREIYLDGLQRLLDHHRTQRAYKRAIACAQQILQREPLRENILRELMQLRVLSGDRNRALTDYRQFQQRLVEELGIQPLPETIAVYEQLLHAELLPVTRGVQSETTVDQSFAASLPANLTFLWGRERETASVCDLLLRANVRILTVIGPPGVGKTSLAVQVAEQLAGRFTNGVAFVNLVPVTQASLVIGAISRALGVQEIAASSGLPELQTYLQDKNLLIVLDNFEQVLDAASHLPAVLKGAPKVKLLITSREALRISGEYEFPLTPLPFPDDRLHTLNELEAYPAIQLFIERARAAQPDFQFTEENAAQIAEICRRLDGLPLAIELAAARIQTLSPAAMLQRFDRRLQWLTRGRRDVPIWQRGLVGAFESSHTLLSEAEQILLRRLSVFAGGWTIEAAEEVCSDEKKCTRAEILNLLLSLVDKSLVVTRPEGARYYFLESIREFAYEKLKGSGEEEVVRGCHLAHFADWAENVESLIEQVSWRASHQLVEPEFNNVRAALDWAMHEQASVEDGLRLIAAASLIWLEHNHFKEGWEWAEKFLARSNLPEHQALQAKLLYRSAALAYLGYWKDRRTQAHQLFLEAENLARNLRDKKSLACALYTHTRMYLDGGEWEPARLALEESVALCRKLEYFSQLSLSLATLGIVLQRQGHQDEARAVLDEALQIAKQTKDIRGEGYALRMLANNLRIAGQFAEALSISQRALEVTTRVGDRLNVGQVLVNMAVLANAVQDYSTSGKYAKEAFDIFQAIGNEYQQPFPLRLMAYSALHTGDLKQARTLCMESLRRNQALGPDHKIGVVASLVTLAEIYLVEKNLDRAARLIVFVNSRLQKEGYSLAEPDAFAFERVAKAVQSQMSVKDLAASQAKWEN
jgi:predicted ATPase/DNA-binding SARP family transcriptional activator